MTRGSGAAGHLHAVVRIEVPTVVDDRQKALYKELAEISNFNPRAQLEREARPMTAPIEDAVYLDTVTEVTWTQLVARPGLPESELTELVRYGALVPRDPERRRGRSRRAGWRWRRPLRAFATISSSIRTASASSCATSSGSSASKPRSARFARNAADHRPERRGADATGITPDVPA